MEAITLIVTAIITFLSFERLLDMGDRGETKKAIVTTLLLVAVCIVTIPLLGLPWWEGFKSIFYGFLVGIFFMFLRGLGKVEP